MNEYDEMRLVAKEVECVDFVNKMEALSNGLKSQELTKVAVTGLRNSGKTTFINDIVGSEVREPGNMDDAEKPLRVCFEPMNEDDRYQCIMVANHEWHDLGVVLYEFRQEDFIEENVLVEDMYSIDMVFFMISATAPFNIDEINFLKAMPFLNRQVVVNGIDYVKDAERQKVINYIVKINDSLGLPPVIVLRSGQDKGRMVRNTIPGYVELKENRDARQHHVFLYTLDKLEDKIKRRISENDEMMKLSSARASQMSAEIKRIKADCYTIRMDIDNYKKNAVTRISEDMGSKLEAMVLEVTRAKGKSDSNEKIQKLAEDEYHKAAKYAVDSLQEAFLADVNKADASIRLLAISGWNEDIMEELKAYAPQYTYDKPKFDPTLEPAYQGTSGITESIKVLIGTGLVVGGFVLAPLPSVVSWAGGIAAAGIGGASYVKKRQAENETAFSNGMKEAFREGINSINKLVRESAEYSYGKINELLLRCEQNLDNKENDSRISDNKEAALKKLLEECSELKKKHNDKKQEV